MQKLTDTHAVNIINSATFTDKTIEGLIEQRMKDLLSIENVSVKYIERLRATALQEQALCGLSTPFITLVSHAIEVEACTAALDSFTFA